MKNRKFIKKIIFSILLLLCVCVPFLVHKNNVKAETNITDLTNTEWIINETLILNENLGQNESKNFSITGTYNSLDGSSNLIELPISSITSYRYNNVGSIKITCPEETSSYTFNEYYFKNSSLSLTGDIRVSYTISHSLRFYGSTNTNFEKLRTFIITGGNDVNNEELISLITVNATQINIPEEPEIFDLTLEEYEENDISFSSSSNFYYSINDSGYFVPLITSETNLPYTIDEVSSVTFKNDNIENDLVLYDRVTLPVSILTIVEPGQQYTLDITEDLTLWLGQAPSDNPIPPTPGETNVVSGGYRFNTLVSSSIFGDINEQELDILFEENFYLYNDTSRGFDMFTLHTENADGTGAQYFCYENSISGDFVYAGVVSSDKSYISIFSSYRTIEWETQYVSPEVYTYLIDNGNFGDYEIPPTEPSPDNPLGWLIDNVNDFLQIEILPGLPIIWLIQFALIVPLCMIVLKMYFGG